MRNCIFLAGMAVSLVGVLAACESGGNPTAFDPTPEFVEMLKAKAEALAKSELARLREAEKLYKDEVFTELYEDHPFNPSLGVVYKRYRQYTGYTIADIRRTESFVAPIGIVIDFDYQLMGTLLRPTDMENAEGLTAEDTEFSSLKERTLRRVYDCDMHGGIMTVPPPPPPDTYYKPGIGAWEKGRGPVDVSAAPAKDPGTWREELVSQTVYR